MLRPGRRQALAGFLAGAATLIGRSARPTAAKKKGKPKKPRARCPAPTICPPLPAACPVRKACCVCRQSTRTPGCQFSAQDPGIDLSALCADLCGGTGTFSDGKGSTLGGATTTFVCSGRGTACVQVNCPLF